MAKRFTVGSGITKRERVLIESADDMREWVEQAKGAWDCIGIIERQAVQILNDAGLPTEHAAYFDRPSPAVQSPEWYALQVLTWAGRLRKSADDGKGLEAGRCGVYMGQLWAEAVLKFRWEEHALRGKKSPVSGRKGHEHTHGTTQEKQERWGRYVAEVNALLAKNARLSRTDARRQIAKKYGVTPKTILRAEQRLSVAPRKKNRLIKW